jgi:predicted glutamine amidotransferase
MCGICGVKTKKGQPLTTNQYKRFLQLLVLNEVRGDDSTGVAYVSDKVRIKKDITPAKKFVVDLIHSKYKLKGTHTLLGHTRFATVGEVTKKNAHPYRIGKVVGVHNGMLNNYKDIYPKAKVDSQGIFKALDSEPTILNAFEKLQGSFAIAHLNIDDKDKLYLTRSGNPLFIAETDGAYYFSSIQDSLDLILLGIGYSITQVEPDYCWELSKMGIKKFKVKFKEASVITYSYPTADSYYYGGGYNRWNNDTGFGKYRTKTQNSYQKLGYEKMSGVGNMCDICGKKQYTEKMFIEDGTKTQYCKPCLDGMIGDCIQAQDEIDTISPDQDIMPLS